MTGLQVDNLTDTGFGKVAYKDGDELYVYTPDGTAAKDLFPDGNESYQIQNPRVIQLVAQTAGDDGTLLVVGR